MTSRAYNKPHDQYFIISFSHFPISLALLLIVCCFFNLCCCFTPNQDFNLSAVANAWSSAGATWYGSPNGAGSDGGSCGYLKLVSRPPYSSFVTGIGPSLYQGGKACGACYQVKCSKSQNPACSGNPVRVVITDFCPGGPCAGSAHFDLSGTAFGAMAIRGQEAKLRNAGVLKISYARVPCDYSTTKIAFRVDQGSNPYYLAVVILFQEGDGDLGAVALRQSSGKYGWQAMQHSWGAVWMLNAGSRLRPPFSIKLRSLYSGQTLVATNVIPAGWKPGATYTSSVNFL